jgi:hypothetical protein
MHRVPAGRLPAVIHRSVRLPDGKGDRAVRGAPRELTMQPGPLTAAARAGSARGGGDGDQGSEAGPDARMTCWKASGGLLCEHAPPDRAPIFRMLIWYRPWPLMPANLPVPWLMV